MTAELRDAQQEVSGSWHYNEGIAAQRSGELGKAVFHFRRAQDLRPRDADVKANLNYVRSLTKDHIEANSSDILALLGAPPLSPREGAYVVAAPLGLMLLVGAASLASSNARIRTATRILAGLALVTTLLGAWSLWSAPPFGVVLAPEVNIYSGAGTDNVHLFSLHAGAEFRLEGEQQGWLQIRLSDGKRGWLAQEAAVYNW